MERKAVTTTAFRYAFMLLGSILAAAGLEIFLKTHNLLGGGILGMTVLLSYLADIPVSVAAVFLNFPFFLVLFRQKGGAILLPSLFAMTSLFYWMSVFNPYQIDDPDIITSTLFGGVLLGLGSGIILRCGGCIDGVEYYRQHFKKQYSSSASGVFILVTLLTACIAGLTIGWESAAFSIGAYFIAFKVIDLTNEMFEKTGRYRP
jgi:uncharacterized membrane-anchored protein YitT (DUF2179 family)